MCGIVGAVDVKGEVDALRLDAARRSLRHRGPDGEGAFVSDDGCVALGFRRLSIIDLTAAAAQPMPNEDGQIQLVFNGEIYNYAALRRELSQRGHRLRSRGDSETVVHLYEELGEAAVHRLTGMFAFAIWDAGRQRLVLARDRLGIKPLYYAWDGRRLVFASELRALLALGVRPDVDAESLSDYLAYGYVPHDRALVQGVRKLPAGHVAVLDVSVRDLRVSQYWDVEPTADIASEQEAAETLSTLLDEVTRDHLAADVPVGLFLSGGLDSTAVLASVAGAQATPVQTFSMTFDTRTTADADFARGAARTFGAEHHERVVGLGDARSFLYRLGDVYDEPLADSSTIPTYEVSRFARERVTVALSGDGGDEVFGGYGRYERHLDALRARSQRPVASGAARRGLALTMPVARRVPVAGRAAVLERRFFVRPEAGYFRHVGFFDGWEAARLQGPAYSPTSGRDPLWLLEHFARPDLPTPTALRYLDLKTYLVDDILAKVDRASMACSLEVRPPLLDHRIVEFAFSLDDRLVRGKKVLRQVLERHGTTSIARRGKSGFGSPVRAWLRAELATEAAAPEAWAIADAGLIRPEFVRRFMRHRVHNRWAKLWALLVLERWYRSIAA